MSEPAPRVLTGLSSEVGKIVLIAKVDEAKKTFSIELKGSPINGDLRAIEEAKRLLAGRVLRVRPDLRFKGA